jgi:hypothetical protein
VAGLSFGTAREEGVRAAVVSGGDDGADAVPGLGRDLVPCSALEGEGEGAMAMKAAPGAAFLPLVSVFTSGVETLPSFFLEADPEAVVDPLVAFSSSSGEGDWSTLGWDFFQSLAASTFKVLRPVFVTREPSLGLFLFLLPFLPIVASERMMGVGRERGKTLEGRESCRERDGRSRSRSSWTRRKFDL